MEPDHEQAWIWLSGAVSDDEEQRYCLERVIALNPEHRVAQRALARFPADLLARSPDDHLPRLLLNYGIVIV